VERQHGSSEEKEQSGPQRIGAQGRSHARAEQGSPQGSPQGGPQAQVARFEAKQNGKAGVSAGFFACTGIVRSNPRWYESSEGGMKAPGYKLVSR